MGLLRALNSSCAMSSIAWRPQDARGYEISRVCQQLQGPTSCHHTALACDWSKHRPPAMLQANGNLLSCLCTSRAAPTVDALNVSQERKVAKTRPPIAPVALAGKSAVATSALSVGGSNRNTISARAPRTGTTQGMPKQGPRRKTHDISWQRLRLQPRACADLAVHSAGHVTGVVQAHVLGTLLHFLLQSGLEGVVHWQASIQWAACRA